MKSTAIIAIMLIGIVLVSGCIGDTTNDDNTDNGLTDETASTDQVMDEFDQNLIDETSEVEIGDMV